VVAAGVFVDPRRAAELAGDDQQDAVREAALFDVFEDTSTTAAELEREFGAAVRRLVEEVTDDKALPSAVRKQRQIERAPALSPGAKLIRISDKTCNVRDVTYSPPTGWTVARRCEYLDWTEAVVARCRGVHPALESDYDRALAAGRAMLLAKAV
jgi:(p)ppGpp synthase/HD superfamily hydrolase